MDFAVRFRPWSSRVSALTQRNILIDEAVEQQTLAPAQPLHLKKTIELPNQAEKICGFTSASNRQQQESNLYGTIIENGPTKLYRYKDVLLTPSGFYSSRRFVRRPGARRELLPYTDHIEEIEDGLYISSRHIEKYFGHWIHDASPQEQLAKNIGLRPVMADLSKWTHVAEYRDLADLSQPLLTKAVFFRSIWIADDRHLNSHRVSRLHQLRDKVVSGLPATKARQGVFIRRRMAGSRELRNEAEIIETLRQKNFSVLDPTQSTAREIAAILSNSKIAIAIEGSAVCHTLLSLREGAGLIVIQPADHFNALGRIYANAMGHHYGYTVADRVEGGYVQNTGDLMRTIDLVETAMAAS
ncbi:glycosyltransferase family 61 protein [Paracoccus sp. S3-43]|uniref:glycosyltransferase 61 family protein n=1 Tax=Paracoccus sp. S3-43 TaxID=3030011 RepID=UPI0023AF7484|nr:glycosyltransferase family 61 protein [Paracoccus sp. S3-43]WEF23769.1 glycosyltransferase family 61 protein [Paracoccus sp. S3-43]